MIKRITYIAFIFLLILVLSPLPSAAIGIGAAPSSIDITGAFREGEYERSISVINPNENAQDFSLRTVGEVGSWISLYGFEDLDTTISMISVPAKENSPVLVKINIPSDVPTGNYSGTIFIETIPDEVEESGGVATKLLARVFVNIEIIGDQILSGVVNDLYVEDTEPGYPLKIKTIFKNTGNVVATPKITVTILKDTTVLDSFTYEENVKPAVLYTIVAKWNTTSSNAPGDYMANVDVSLDGEILTSKNIPFKLWPEGTFSRQGNLTKIFIEGDLKKGSLLKIKATFKNTGQILSKAKFIGEVYKDGSLIDTVSSEEFEIERDNEAVLVSYLRLGSNGDYMIKGKVVYSGKKTPEVEIPLKVGKSMPGFEGISLIAVMLLLIMIRGKKKSRKM